MAYLKAFDKDGKLVAVGKPNEGNKGYITIENLIPNTEYEQGEFIISWVSEDFETEGVESPYFMTHNSEYKEFMFYYHELLELEGKSAYQIALRNGFTGTEEEWVESIKGDKGDKLSFSDLTEEDKEELRGEPGKPGEKGDTLLAPPKIYTRDEYNQLENKDSNTLYFISEV